MKNKILAMLLTILFTIIVFAADYYYGIYGVGAIFLSIITISTFILIYLIILFFIES